MNVHFIAIGGSAMHNLAIALVNKGYQVTGSDDEIFEPSKSRLKKYNILPDTIGWDEASIHKGLDAVILGMHARADNPELKKAEMLGLPIYSYPEYIYNQTQNKTRVVIGGSHGKTSITSMILHVLDRLDIEADFMVGAQLDGFECMVRLTETAKIAILEGDEYLSSPIDRRPKFHLYKPNIALISGIAWDHINVFPTFDIYLEQFSTFIDLINDEGVLVYCKKDQHVAQLVEKNNGQLKKVGYDTHKHIIEKGITYLETETGLVPINVFGEHNLQNLNGARLICAELGVSDEDFYQAIASFAGAAKRLEKVVDSAVFTMYKDFAHSPSKLKATTNAVKAQYPNRKLVACMELHTFSSLNKTFLLQYDGAMSAADTAMVYFNPETVKHKKLEDVTPNEVLNAFNSENVRVYTDSRELQNDLQQMNWDNQNLLMMSSGNFDGINFEALGASLIGDQV